MEVIVTVIFHVSSFIFDIVKVKHVRVIWFISSFKTATLLQVKIWMTSYSLNRIEWWIWYLNWFNIPNALAVLNYGFITTQIATFCKGSKTSSAKLIWIFEDFINFLLSFTIWVKVCLDEIVIPLEWLNF